MLVCVSISKRDEQRRRFFGWNETRQSTVVEVPVVPVHEREMPGRSLPRSKRAAREEGQTTYSVFGVS